MRVLVVTADVPWPCVGGARTRNAHLVQALLPQHDVEVLALRWDDKPAAAPAGVALQTIPWTLPPLHAAADDGDEAAWTALYAAGAEPYGVSYYDSPAMEDAVAQTCSRRRPDVAVFTETAAARFRHRLPEGVPFVLDLHDVHSVKQARHGDYDQATRVRVFEAAAAADAAVTVCVSPLEASAARAFLGAARVEVVPNGVDTRRFIPADGAGDSDRLVFTGSLHTRENVEAMVWFVEQVLPRVLSRRPRVRLDVVGSRPADDVRRLHGGAVAVHADVPDTVPYLHAAGVAVVPLLHGGGTRLKVLEAAASGRAVVTTPVGVEGLPLRGGEEVVLADDADAFAEAVLRLCADPAERVRLSAAALGTAASYDWRLIGATWRSVVESVAR